MLLYKQAEKKESEKNAILQKAFLEAAHLEGEERELVSSLIWHEQADQTTKCRQLESKLFLGDPKEALERFFFRKGVCKRIFIIFVMRQQWCELFLFNSVLSRSKRQFCIFIDIAMSSALAALWFEGSGGNYRSDDPNDWRDVAGCPALTFWAGLLFGIWFALITRLFLYMPIDFLMKVLSKNFTYSATRDGEDCRRYSGEYSTPALTHPQLTWGKIYGWLWRGLVNKPCLHLPPT